MKKVSISLATVLAIVFAVASAFTTANKGKSPTAYKAFYLFDGTVPSSPVPSNATADSYKVGSALHSASTSFEVSPYGICDSEPNVLCVVEIAYESSGLPSTGNVVDFKTGIPQQ
jgi:hypothetical protein